MKKQINLYRVVLNMLFYIFYVLLVSIIFSFIFPTILVILGKSVLAPNDPLFANIQIAIVILVFIFTLNFRKFFYLPIFSTEEKIEKNDKLDNNAELSKDYNTELKNDNKINITKTEEVKDNIVDNKENTITKTEEVKYEVIYNNIVNKNNTVEEKVLVDNFPDLDIKIGKEIK